MVRLDKPLPDAVYHELRELQTEVEELERDWDHEDATDMGPRIRKLRARFNDLLLEADLAMRKEGK